MSHSLPVNFPNSLLSPLEIGARVRWLPLPSAVDWGTVVGILFEWHQGLSGWYPRYCVWLAPDSPSHDWINSDWAWSWDLEQLESGNSDSSALQVESNC